MADIASGMRKKFGTFAPMVSADLFSEMFCSTFSCFQVAPVILEKFKEKKPVVATAMVECIDAIAKTVSMTPFAQNSFGNPWTSLQTTLDALTEDLLASLDSKTPSVKMQTTMFLARYFSGCSPAVLNKKVLKTFCPAFIKVMVAFLLLFIS